MTFGFRLLRVAVAAAALSWSFSASGDAPSVSGRYCFSGGPKEEEALRKELDRVADQFNFFARGIARKKLHQRVRPYTQVRLTGGEGPLRVQLDQVTLVCDGRWHSVTGSQGEDGKAVCRLDGAQLHTRSEYDEATRINTFSFSENGDSAKMEAVLHSSKLPDTIQFQLSYSDC